MTYFAIFVLPAQILQAYNYMQISIIHAAVTTITALLVGVMALCLFTVAMPRDRKLAPYRVSRYILAGGYLLLSSACLLAVWAGVPHTYEVNPLVRIITLVAATFQGVMCQYTILSLVNPMSLSFSRIAASLLPVVAVDLALVSVYIWGSERLSDMVFYVVCGLYFLLLAIYENIFRREYRDYMVAINNYFADDEGFHLRWIRTAYYLAFSLGLLAGFSLFLPSMPFIVFIGLVGVFYVYYAIRYIGYARVFPRMAPALEPLFDGAGGGAQAGREDMAATIAEWIGGKGFLQPGITLASVSEKLGLPRSAFAMYIRRKGGRSFSRWINELRVDEARELIIAFPGMSLQEVAQRAGFSTMRLFIGSFETVEGEEPRYFQERIRLHSGGKYFF